MEIQSAMAEIHQTANFDQKTIVEKADNALAAKRDAVPGTGTLTELDAMRIQIQNIQQTYLRALIVVEPPKPHGGGAKVPQKKVATANRTSLCYATRLQSEDDIDAYVEDLRKKLKDMLEGNDILHII